jgi:5'-nucleotidase
MPYAMPMATPAAYVAPAGAGVPAYLPPGGGDSVAPAAATIPFAPVPAIEQAPSHAAPTIKLAKSESKTYVVKPGDTLFRIARNRYGEGSAWHNIAAANPGLSPATLKAGQTLVMP